LNRGIVQIEGAASIPRRYDPAARLRQSLNFRTLDPARAALFAQAQQSRPATRRTRSRPACRAGCFVQGTGRQQRMGLTPNSWRKCWVCGGPACRWSPTHCRARSDSHSRGVFRSPIWTVCGPPPASVMPGQGAVRPALDHGRNKLLPAPSSRRPDPCRCSLSTTGSRWRDAAEAAIGREPELPAGISAPAPCDP